jgi:hypothetical protein
LHLGAVGDATIIERKPALFRVTKHYLESQGQNNNSNKEDLKVVKGGGFRKVLFPSESYVMPERKETEVVENFLRPSKLKDVPDVPMGHIFAGELPIFSSVCAAKITMTQYLCWHMTALLPHLPMVRGWGRMPTYPKLIGLTLP